MGNEIFPPSVVVFWLFFAAGVAITPAITMAGYALRKQRKKKTSDR